MFPSARTNLKSFPESSIRSPVILSVSTKTLALPSRTVMLSFFPEVPLMLPAEKEMVFSKPVNETAQNRIHARNAGNLFMINGSPRLHHPNRLRSLRKNYL